jgi:hypothetical protein
MSLNSNEYKPVSFRYRFSLLSLSDDSSCSGLSC